MFKEYFFYYQECVKDLDGQRSQSLKDALMCQETKRRRMAIVMLVSIILLLLSMFITAFVVIIPVVVIGVVLFVSMIISALLINKYDRDRIELYRFEKMDSRIEYIDMLSKKMESVDTEKNYLYPIITVEHYESLINDVEKERDKINENMETASKIVSFAFSVIITIAIEILKGNNLIAFAALIISYGGAAIFYNKERKVKKLQLYNDFINDIHDIIDYEKGYYGGEYKFSQNQRETQ